MRPCSVQQGAPQPSEMAAPVHPCLSVTGCQLPGEGHDLERGSSWGEAALGSWGRPGRSCQLETDYCPHFLQTRSRGGALGGASPHPPQTKAPWSSWSFYPDSLLWLTVAHSGVSLPPPSAASPISLASPFILLEQAKGGLRLGGCRRKEQLQIVASPAQEVWEVIIMPRHHSLFFTFILAWVCSGIFQRPPAYDIIALATDGMHVLWIFVFSIIFLGGRFKV